MKNALLSISLILALSSEMYSQVAGNHLYADPQSTMSSSRTSGNNQYNYEQRPSNSDRDRLSTNHLLDKNEITVRINGLYNATPDSYVATFNLVQVAETAELTNQLFNQRIVMFQQQLCKIRVDTNDVRVDMISFVPKYEFEPENKLFSKTYNEIPSGFELQKNISIHYRDSKLLDRLVTAAAQSEIYDLVKVDCFLNNASKLIDSLRTRCIQEMSARAKSFRPLGLKIDTLKKVLSENIITVYPDNRYFNYQAFSQAPKTFSKKKTLPTLNEINKTVSKYYSKLEYDNYEIVVNPIILEPIIQISYNLTIKYFTNPDEPRREVYMLTPLGDLKKLALEK